MVFGNIFKSRRGIAEIKAEELLFRKPLDINGEAELGFYRGRTVLVTGGGGSIGSELCRCIAMCKPKRLIILDYYENNAYEIQQELLREYAGELELDVEIASVRDTSRMEAVFAFYRPEIVFHAAAHKHVPLMEHNACEAVKNNVFGTVCTADMAEKYGAEKFVLVSTDKAVNPTNIMGASKRVCEMAVLCRSDSKTAFSAVRLGNVLGSNGSVIPLFKRQIAAGGPVTVTDKRVIRYFMTVTEAARLIIQAGAMANRGELFVLDMGKPVKIYDLAVNMIRLSGLRPGRDIEIKEIGLRPGEKLYEELLLKPEGLEKTANDMIFIEKDEEQTRAQVEEKLALLSEAVREDEGKLCGRAVREALKRAVPTFREPKTE
jgi:FlaA1/EpsC-like NDP-sugar epimerase